MYVCVSITKYLLITFSIAESVHCMYNVAYNCEFVSHSIRGGVHVELVQDHFQ